MHIEERFIRSSFSELVEYILNLEKDIDFKRERTRELIEEVVRLEVNLENIKLKHKGDSIK